MTFMLGKRSAEILLLAHRDIQEVVNHAITLTDTDFSVIETIRTPEQQRLNIESGVSWSMDSDHLPDENGVSRAVDIYPWASGATSHDPEHYKRVAKAMFTAAQQHGIGITWGGFWRGDQEDSPHWSLL